ncbi:hypothetical protein [Bordetella sp. FB-8]|uniref:hypothetical protein n=1 Tax=Bordetella sp. FB-8 TaxID=1159870 RepID=UPI0012DFD1C1|nr:hypothetical protein [Bordetella sp. FB-8]
MAIIFGLPKPQADRIKGEIKKGVHVWSDGWIVHFVPPTGAKSQMREADIRVALTNATAANQSVHVLGITNQGGDTKKETAAHFLPYFRFRWLPGQWLALPYPSPEDFISKVNETLVDEDDWRRVVQPDSIASPLLLPESSFSTKLSDIWDLATRYGDGCNAGCDRRKNEFDRIHYKPHTSKKHAKDYFWTDDAQRIFDHTKEQHGEAPELRQWKYSFRIPIGFHYDVRHAEARKFTVAGAIRSENVESGGYVNLDSHGHFRD